MARAGREKVLTYTMAIRLTPEQRDLLALAASRTPGCKTPSERVRRWIDEFAQDLQLEAGDAHR